MCTNIPFKLATGSAHQDSLPFVYLSVAGTPIRTSVGHLITQLPVKRDLRNHLVTAPCTENKIPTQDYRALEVQRGLLAAKCFQLCQLMNYRLTSKITDHKSSERLKAV